MHIFSVGDKFMYELPATFELSNPANVSSTRVVWRYKYADWNRACELINDTDLAVACACPQGH